MDNTVLGQKLQGINLKKSMFQSTEQIIAAEIEMVFETHKLVIRPLCDTDEVEYEYILLTENSPFEIFHPFSGRKLSSVWQCRNNNGYFDMLGIGFDELHPALLILSEGSSLKLFTSSIWKSA